MTLSFAVIPFVSLGAARRFGCLATFAALAPFALVACNTPPKEASDSAAAATLPSPSMTPAATAATASSSPLLSPASTSTAGGGAPRGVGLGDASIAPTSTATTVGAAGGIACKKDSDCRTFSSYCAESPCACRVLLASSPDPKCLGATKVNCFADPCMKKAANCQSGACALTAN